MPIILGFFFLHEHCICGLLLKPSQIHPLLSTPLKNLIHHVKSKANVWGIEYLSKRFHLSFHFGSVEYLLTGSRFLISCCSTYNCIVEGALDTASAAKIRRILPSSYLFLKYSSVTFTLYFERNQSSREQSTRREPLGEDVWGENYWIIHTDHQVLSIHFYRLKRNPHQRLLTPYPQTPNYSRNNL